MKEISDLIVGKHYDNYQWSQEETLESEEHCVHSERSREKGTNVKNQTLTSEQYCAHEQWSQEEKKVRYVSAIQ